MLSESSLLGLLGNDVSCAESTKAHTFIKMLDWLGWYLCALSPPLPELLGKVKNAGLTSGTCINLLKSG